MFNNRVSKLVFGVVVIAVVAWGGYSIWRNSHPKTSGTRQAIFLNDGQVYFGYASNLHDQVVTLTDVYYLQVQQPIQSSSTGKTDASATQQINLIKLGNELHGPKDKMLINRDHIMFIEDMKDDSQVNQKISDYLKNKK